MLFPPRRNKPQDPHPDPRDKHQRIDKIHVLRRCPLFKSLSGWELSSISRLTRIREFKKDEVVYRAGEASGDFFIVVSGRFEAHVLTDGKKHVLAYLKQGAYFGEMSLLSDERHTATVQALSDSLVLAIAKDDFKRIVENNARVALEMSRVLTQRVRAQNLPQERPPHLLRSEMIAVYSSHRKTGQTSFSINLAASLHHETGQRTLLVDMSPTGTVIFGRLKIGSRTDLSAFEYLEKGVEGALGSHLRPHASGVEVLDLGTGGTRDMVQGRAAELATHLMNRLLVDFRFIVIDLPNQLDETVVKVMAQADHLFFVTDNNMGNVAEIKQVMQELQQTIAGTEEKSRVVISESLLGFSPTSTVKRELFGKKDCWFLPAAPAGREEADPSESLVVLKLPDTDYAKVVRHIARKVSRNFVGLALGSGAALGFAHIGVLKVLERERIPIDCLAGSSMGALIAGFYATGRSAVALEEIASRMGKFALLSKVDFDFVPVRGLIRGHRFLRFFESFFRDMTFEEAKIPLIITAMSLLSRKEILFNSGLIATAIRASISIPGIFHPVALGGDILVDGGIIDPLPIRPLADLGANKIIAVDVLPTSSDVLEKRSHMEERERRLDAKIRNRMLLVRALHQAGKLWQKIFDPNVVDIIVNTMQTMEHELAEGAAAEADICIRPSMPLFNWVEFHRSKEIIRQGELAAEAQLEDIKALVRQQVA